MRKPVLLILAAALAVPLSPAVASARAPETVQWGECPSGTAKPGLDCGTLRVPLDYRNPGGRTIELAISRLRAADPENRRGVLLTNSGGPGGEGLTFPAVLRDLGLPRSVLAEYDAIGMDPRGVAHSTPVTCATPAEYWSNIPEYPLDSADVTTRAKTAAKLARQCGTSRTAALLPHIDTTNTARDLDRVRAALGEPRASYFGWSYGSYLGAVYASMFPERTDRVVLDSSTGPGGWDAELSKRFGKGFADRFPDFARFAATHPGYGLGNTPEQVKAKYFELAARLDAKPSPQGINGKTFRQLTFGNLYFDEKLPSLAADWQALDTGKPLPPADPAPPPAPGIPGDNYLAAQLHVTCNDSDWPEKVRSYRKNVEAQRWAHPMFGAAGANITPCAFWPAEREEPRADITGHGPANVLIMQNLRDPATPLPGARKMRAALGHRARMVTADQGGHTAYLRYHNTCADDAVTNFLTTGARPRKDLACGQPGSGKP
ncbi:alpha/beta hydrolase [Sciscionella marina]|uniref:alpha/beta hydrolase n=1 Tax=Sciscionella marina TaxID=508770 RepID=UPI00036A3FCE|nr:alpha/beta hydrolase [Sciscionella marina]